MPEFSLDSAIFITFLTLNLLVGLFYGRKVRTLKDYALGGKNFSTATITATITATWISGSAFSIILSKVYTEGLYFITVAVAGLPIAALFTGRVLALRMSEFLNNISVAEAMGSLYGTVARRITAIAGIAASIAYIAIQFKVGAKALGLIFSLQGSSAAIATAIIVIVYSAFGGVRSVTFTDVIQFITFCIFIPIVALVIWNNLKEPSKVLFLAENHSFFNFSLLFDDTKKVWQTAFLLIYFMIPTMGPPIFQRIALNHNVEQVKRSFTVAALLCLLITLFIIWVAVLLLAHNPTLPPSNLLSYIIEHYAYSGLKGLIAAGVMAMVMSTADSWINACAVLFSNDIVPNKVFTKHPLRLVRGFAFLLGGGALAIALKMEGVFNIALLSSSFYMPIVTVPLLMAIFGFRSTPRAALTGMFAGFTIVLFWRTAPWAIKTGINSVFPGMLANLCFLLGYHYLFRQKGGWVGIKDPTPLLIQRQARQTRWRQLKYRLRHIHPLRYLDSNLPAQAYAYFGFGLYAIGATYASLYTLSDTVREGYGELYQALYHSVLVATTVFLTYPIWPATFKDKRLIRLAWPLGIFYILFVAGGLLVLMSGFHEMQVMIFLLNLLMATLLLRWPLVIAFFLVGPQLASFIFKAYMHTSVLPVVQGGAQFKVVYGLLMLSSFLLALVDHKRRKKRLEAEYSSLDRIQQDTIGALQRLEATPHRFLQHLYRGKSEVFEGAEATGAALAKSLAVVKTPADVQQLQKQVRLLNSQVKESSAHLEKAVEIIQHEQALRKHSTPLNHFLDHFSQQLTPNYPAILLKNHSSVNKFQADLGRLDELLLASLLQLQVAQKRRGSVYCYMDVYDAYLHYDLYSQEAVPALAFVVGTTPQGLAAIQSWPKTFHHRDIPLRTDASPLQKKQHEVINMLHYGYVHLSKNPLTYTYVMPQAVNTVRPKTFKDIPMPKPLTASQAWLAKTIEAQFWQEVSKKGEYNLSRLEKAVAFVKETHAHQRRQSGEPYYTHPLVVATKVCSWTAEEDVILAALLHDTLEDTNVSAEEIGVLFGTRVRGIVELLSNLRSGFKKFNLEQLRTNAKVLEQSGDRGGILVKLCDRWHNLETLAATSPTKQVRKAGDTMNVYVPMAKAVGYPAIATALEKLAKPYLKESDRASTR